MRLAAMVSYLLAWGAVVVGAGWQLWTSLQLWGALGAKRAAAADNVGLGPGWQTVVGTGLQGASLAVLTGRLGAAPLAPTMVESWLTVVLAPMGAALFWWALLSKPKGSEGLATGRAFGFVRHPMYLGFGCMVAATAGLAGSGWLCVPAMALYVAGTEVRIAEEERQLLAEHGVAYVAYRGKVRWAYLIGLR